METLYPGAPQDLSHYTNEEIRRNFMIGGLFAEDRVKLVYCQEDRMIVGACSPRATILETGEGAPVGTPFLLSAREMGIANIGGCGSVEIDGQIFDLDNRDVLYVGRGARRIRFASQDPARPARFYLNCVPAGHDIPHRLIRREEALRACIGDEARCNVRTIATYIHPQLAPSCLLMLGITEVAARSVWNTMPPHLHERRMEAYLYFDMAPDDRVIHLLGRPDNTRHIIVAGDEVVIAPSWSVHMGVGTGPYSFIWGMTGENQAYTDVTPLTPADLA